ncbi:MAG: hypothetical protein U9N34_07345 [Candidatus Cloacimonadota bacterium]|nr:hypothetical protein [Candidatus Cloacimonadota bacterium]
MANYFPTAQAQTKTTDDNSLDELIKLMQSMGGKEEVKPISASQQNTQRNLESDILRANQMKKDDPEPTENVVGNLTSSDYKNISTEYWDTKINEEKSSLLQADKLPELSTWLNTIDTSKLSPIQYRRYLKAWEDAKDKEKEKEWITTMAETVGVNSETVKTMDATKFKEYVIAKQNQDTKTVETLEKNAIMDDIDSYLDYVPSKYIKVDSTNRKGDLEKLSLGKLNTIYDSAKVNKSAIGYVKANNENVPFKYKDKKDWSKSELTEMQEDVRLIDLFVELGDQSVKTDNTILTNTTERLKKGNITNAQAMDVVGSDVYGQMMSGLNVNKDGKRKIPIPDIREFATIASFLLSDTEYKDIVTKASQEHNKELQRANRINNLKTTIKVGLRLKNTEKEILGKYIDDVEKDLSREPRIAEMAQELNYNDITKFAENVLGAKIKDYDKAEERLKTYFFGR